METSIGLEHHKAFGAEKREARAEMGVIEWCWKKQRSSSSRGLIGEEDGNDERAASNAVQVDYWQQEDQHHEKTAGQRTARAAMASRVNHVFVD
jgi:hypothetical protein